MAVVEVKIPTILQKVVGCPNIVKAKGDTVGQVLNEMEKNYPGLKGRIIDPQGKLNNFIIIFVNDQDIRFKKELDTHLQDGDVLFILPAIAGGLFIL
jgi:molybdopterin synthase sulfur carrier subunit